MGTPGLQAELGSGVGWVRLPGAGVGGDVWCSVALGEFVEAFCDLAEVEGVVVEPCAHEIAGADWA